MFKRVLVGLFSVLVVALVSPAMAPRAEAGVGQAVMALAGPLAKQFGVPTGGVTKLLEGGMSLESVTQLLMVSKSSSSSLDSVTSLFNESGKDIDKTAAKLDVDPKAYSDKKVEKSIRKAKKKAQAAAAGEANKMAGEATGQAGAAADSAAGASKAADSAGAAADGAGSAVGSGLGGLEN